MNHPKGYVCLRTPSPPRLDGSLDCPLWSRAPWTDAFVDISTDDVPRFHTRAKMLWDDRCLYIGADLQEPHLWATLTEHDSVIFQDNDFEVFIDPDGDHHNYGEIEINALNTTWDLRLPKPYRDHGSALNEWEVDGMRTAVSLRGTLNEPSDLDDGWSVVLALPWEPLVALMEHPARPGPGDQWRINFSRVQWNLDVVDGAYRKRPGLPEDNWVWTPQGAIDMHRPEWWGYLQFEDAPAPFRPDPDWAVREELMRVYHAQRAFMAAQGRFARNLSELGLELESTLVAGDNAYHVRQAGYRLTSDSQLVRDRDFGAP